MPVLLGLIVQWLLASLVIGAVPGAVAAGVAALMGSPSPGAVFLWVGGVVAAIVYLLFWGYLVSSIVRKIQEKRVQRILHGE